jgi:hypothetical protein
MDLSKPACKRSTTAVGVTLGMALAVGVLVVGVLALGVLALGVLALGEGALGEGALGEGAADAASAPSTAPAEGREAVSALVAAAPIRLKSARHTDKKSAEGLREWSMATSLFLRWKALRLLAFHGTSRGFGDERAVFLRSPARRTEPSASRLGAHISEEHPGCFGALRTRYFVANPGRLILPEQTG